MSKTILWDTLVGYKRDVHVYSGLYIKACIITIYDMPSYMHILPSDIGTHITDPDQAGNPLFQHTVKHTTNGTFDIINYNPSAITSDNVASTGVLKSVVFDEQHNLKCFAPPKSHPDIHAFKTQYPDLTKMNVEKLLDGTMINVFWSSADESTAPETEGQWEIMTRKNIGAHAFYNRYSNNNTQKTFRAMFLEAVDAVHLNMNDLDTTCCYSFLLQHPENRIVTPVCTPMLYLIDVYRLTTEHPGLDIPLFRVDVLSREDAVSNAGIAGSTISFPTTICVSDYEELESIVNEHSPDGSLVKGYTIKDPHTGMRVNMITDEYKFVHSLKNNILDMRLLYLHLRKDRNINTYLHYFPEHSDLFGHYLLSLQDFTHFLYVCYVECYIHKTKSAMEYPKNMRIGLDQIHRLYVYSRAQTPGFSIKFKNVIKLVNNLDPSLLFFIMFVPSRGGQSDHTNK